MVTSTQLEARPPEASFKAAIYARLPAFLRAYSDRLAASPVGSRLARGMVWSLVGGVIARGLGLLASVVAARLLGREGFGEFGVIQSTVGMFGAFAGFGLGLTATKHVAEYRASDPNRAGRIISLSGIAAAISGALMALAMVVLARPLAEHSLAAPHLTGLLQLSASLIFLGALNGAQIGALAGFEAFKTIARVSLWSGIASFPIMVSGVWFGGVRGAVWGMVGSLGVNWLLNHLALRAEARRFGVPIGFAGGGQWKREWRVLWHFSLPAMFCSFMVLPVHWLCLAFLAKQAGGYAETGVFNAANQWRTAILFVPQAMAGIVLPALAGLHLVRERKRYLKVFWGNVALIAGVALAFALGVIVFSDLIMGSYGADFAGGRGTLVLLALSAVVLSINQVLGVDLISRGKMWQALGCTAAWASALLTLAYWLVPIWGAFGLAAAMLASYPVQSLCMLAVNFRRTETPVHEGGPVFTAG